MLPFSLLPSPADYAMPLRYFLAACSPFFATITLRHY